MVVKHPKSTTHSKAKTSRSTGRASSTKSRRSASKSKTTRRTKSPAIVVKALVDPKARARVARKKLKRAPMTWREFLFLGLVGVCILMIAFSFILRSNFHPDKDAEKELSRLANSYYIEYLYPHILGNQLDNPSSVLTAYAESGLPSVLLRQLLTYNNNAHADSARFFSNNYYQCNTANSRVRFYPVEPYGPRDYTIKTDLSCERVDNPDY